jgi:DNA polymerase-1
MPLLVNASRNGIRVNRPLLSSWEFMLSASIAESDKRIMYILGGTFNVDSNEELADMVERAGLLRPEGWERTSTGKRSLSKKAFAAAVPSVPTLVELVSYRNTAATLLRTFVVRWLEDSATDGRLHCQWHQTRSDDGGARTGRISSSNPNLANVPNPQDKIAVPAGLSVLPNLREALLPEQGHTWLSADYSGQELRVLAHYEDNQLPAAYRANPRLDQHQQARDMIEAVSGIKIDRKSAKIVGFALIYGAGDRKLAEQLGVDVATAALLRRAYLQAIPGVAHVQRMAMDRWGRGRPIKTWGGRLVPPQPPSIINGRRVTWEYKALNMLIQGSSADQTKEAIIRLHRAGAGLGLVLLSQLYDELNVSVPTDKLQDGAEVLHEAMTGVPGFDVPFIVDIEAGPTWGTMQPYSIGAKQ